MNKNAQVMPDSNLITKCVAIHNIKKNYIPNIL